MNNYLKNRRNFNYGSGMLSPECEKFIITIPKNASSYISDLTNAYNWTSATVGDNCDWHKINEVIVILRDPLDRWISGISQYLVGYILVRKPHTTEELAKQFVENYNFIIEQLLFDVVDKFDDHVWPQYEFFQNILPDIPKTYFMVNDDFSTKISNYLNLQLIKNLDYNSNKDNVGKKLLHNFFESLLEKKIHLQSIIKEVYKEDYNLINQVKIQ